MTTFPSILIIDGAQRDSTVDQRLIDSTRLVVAQHPKKRHLFYMVKARVTPDESYNRYARGRRLMTRTTLNRLISANLYS